MKVTIGKYVSWFGPYQLAELICFWAKEVPDADGMMSTPDYVHKFGEWLAHGKISADPDVGELVSLHNANEHHTYLSRFLSWVHSKKTRKIHVKIDKWDTWSMDNTLAHIILPMLQQLYAEKHGSPFVDDNDVPAHLQSINAPLKENEHDVDDNHHKRWDWVMTEMIFAFNSKLDDTWEDQFYTGDMDIQGVKLADGCIEMVRGPNYTGKIDTEGLAAYQKRIANGFMLFGKYYQGLWD